MRFVGACRIELAEPAGLGCGPVFQVGLGRLRVSAVAQALVEGEQFVVEATDELRCRYVADVLLDENAAQKRQDQRCVVGPQQPPSRAAAPQKYELVMLHWAKLT